MTRRLFWCIEWIGRVGTFLALVTLLVTYSRLINWTRRLFCLFAAASPPHRVDWRNRLLPWPHLRRRHRVAVLLHRPELLGTSSSVGLPSSPTSSASCPGSLLAVLRPGALIGSFSSSCVHFDCARGRLPPYIFHFQMDPEGKNFGREAMFDELDLADDIFHHPASSPGPVDSFRPRANSQHDDEELGVDESFCASTLCSCCNQAEATHSEINVAQHPFQAEQ
ncbi:hypothetical protein OPV22_030711 [Ensete ventricosum]|uniref:Uncharacterized protein n=1 Tax=Ensete ventricosum TaxID=4639 RepID=A0AAV8PSK3_ENSVE|nr:hypothetical protein OPV22_030711 [Ensete ventricosum]